MKENVNPDFILKLLKFIAQHELSERILWNKNLQFFVLASDLFFWASSDAEEITPETYPVLLECFEAIADTCQTAIGLDLYCCRVRGMRPQKPYLNLLSEHYRALFMACGRRERNKNERRSTAV